MLAFFYLGLHTHTDYINPMPAQLLLSVKDAVVRFAEEPLFNGLSFNIHDGVRIALVGKNGAGKSTLMNMITGKQDLDEGERWEEAGTTIGYLHQNIQPKPGQSVFEYIFEEIDEDEKELHAYKVDIVTDALQIDPEALMTNLSGGQLRRAGIARSLVEEPDLLLLDEPTNHLDLEIIEWLEGYLKSYRGTLVCISHDRTFLSNITNQVFWLDRGQLKVSPRGFQYFDEWSQMLLEQEERELKNRKQSVMQEVEWASRGVKARVKRNVRRLAQVKEMRDKLKADEASFRRATAKIDLKPLESVDATSKIVAEFYNVTKSFRQNDKTIPILNKFSYRIKRGDRIGILGRNGSGKTTFLKMLLGEIEPDEGRVKTRKELEFSYFDQKRRDLDPTHTLKQVLSPSGNDYIDVMGKQRHVCGYLKDFMFDPSRAWDKVSQLSGGQKNRLMLSKILANPKSCLILDEPTNDLDMETLDMLEEILSNYDGTLIVVSHDRDFLDQTVTKILAFEGDGEVVSCIGGYSDYLEKKAMAEGVDDKQGAKPGKSAPSNPKSKNKKSDKAPISPQSSSPQKTSGQNSSPASSAPPPSPSPTKPRKLSYKFEREYETLPGKIEDLESKIKDMNTALADPDFYKNDPDQFHKTVKSLEDYKARLERYETRWLELDELKNAP